MSALQKIKFYTQHGTKKDLKDPSNIWIDWLYLMYEAKTDTFEEKSVYC